MVIISEEKVNKIKIKFESIAFVFNEKIKRLWCASEAINFGKGGVTAVQRATKVSRNTIYSGIKEINSGKKESTIRKKGGGRKKIADKFPIILKDIKNIIEDSTRGDPESVLKWTCKSVRNIREALVVTGHKISFRSVCSLLKDLGFSLQSNKKILEGKNHEDRDKQFQFINNKSKDFLEKGAPVLSIDTKKKENIGNYKNNGKEYAPKKCPVKVNTYDFPDKKLGKVSPYGIYDVGENKGWVSVGISSDTAEFSVNSIRVWWHSIGIHRYSNASEIYINADGGGSNGHKVRLWKTELQRLANEIQKTIHVSHFPPGTSKWNKIEHKMFSYISKNWRGKPLTDTETVINLIANTKTKSGLTINAVLDKNIYKTGIKVSDEELKKINLIKENFHGEWNYKIAPKI